MKYRIKKIRREGWAETEDKLFRPVEDVTPVVPETAELPEGEDEIYIIDDDTSDTEDEGTVVFTPPTPANSAKGSPFDILKTKEGKLIAALVGGFAVLLILFTVIVIALSGGEEPDNNAGSSSTDHAHNYQTIVDKKATCTDKGVTKEKCSICGYITGEETVDALGHKWKVDDKNSKEATCEEAGVEARECERCSEKETVTLEPTEHDWKEDHSDQATCEEDGTVVKTCKTCGKRETETQQAKGHTWIQTTTEEATCETEGKINFRCASCTETKTEVTAKKEHELSDPVRTEPTCALEGKEVAFCSLCKKNVTVVIEKLPHDLESATCESGEKERIFYG